jgi:uncharacterized protein
MMIARTVAAVLLVAASHASAQTTETLANRDKGNVNRGIVEITGGTSASTEVQMMEDMARVFNAPGTRRILPISDSGSLEAISDLKLLHGIDLAIVQTDALSHAQHNGYAPGNLTYITRLHDAELHILARRDIKTVSDLADQTVSYGPTGAGAEVTGTQVFQRLTIPVKALSYDYPNALERLRTGEIAALLVVTGKPAPLFRALDRPDLHLLGIPLTSEVIRDYAPAKLTADDYPRLVAKDESVNTVAVGTALMVANLIAETDRARNVASFTQTFFTQFSKLTEAAFHPKWQEVNLAADVPGWKRYPAAETWLKQNAQIAATPTEKEMRLIFSRFLDERMKASGSSMPDSEKDKLFDEFKGWQQQSLSRRPNTR